MAELRRGSLPPGKLGEPAFRAAWPQARAIADRAREHGSGQEPATLETNVALPNGIRLTGTVSGVRGSTLLGVGYSRLRADARMTAWVRLLALSAAHPAVPYGAITIGRTAEKTAEDEPLRVAIARLAPLADTPAGRRAVALEELAKLVALRDEGLREPLPLPSRAGAAYAQAIRDGVAGREAADRVWTSRWAGNFYFSREDEQPESQIVFGGSCPPTSYSTVTQRRCGSRCCPAKRWRSCERPHPVSADERAPARGDRAGGERRHRQDLHDRGARNAVHRGGGEPRRDAAGDLHAARHRRAARARPRPARVDRARVGGRARGVRPGGPRRRDRGAVAGR